MYRFFYNFFKKPLGWDLFNRDREDGTPSPPESEEIIDQAGEEMTDQTGDELISNS